MEFCTLPQMEGGLAEVMTADGIQASNWNLFRGAIFGRDSLIVADDLDPWYPELTERVVLSLARLQGVARNPLSEEEPGRIHHEHRRFDRTDHVAAATFERLRQAWRIGSDQELTYYGCVDASPRFVSTIAAHCRRHGDSLLDLGYLDRQGQTRDVCRSLLATVSWIMRRLRNSPLGLLEFRHTNPRGIRWQVLRDGATAYIHEDGQLANHTKPIAAIEVQGLAYDALLDAAELFADHPARKAWLAAARRLRVQTLDLFWMPDRQYFAMALDRDRLGQLRQLRTLSSAPAELLATRLFDELPEQEHRRFVEAILRQMFSDEFITDVGLRMRGLSHAELLDYVDYQGSLVSWVVTSNCFARGLRHVGLNARAVDIEQRFLDGLERTRALVEFFFVDSQGRVDYDPMEHQPADEPRTVLAATNIPEYTQAWTVSAAIRAVRQQTDNHELSSLVRPGRAGSFHIDCQTGRDRETLYLSRFGHAS